MADFLPLSQSHLSNQFLTCEDSGELISFTTGMGEGSACIVDAFIIFIISCQSTTFLNSKI